MSTTTTPITGTAANTATYTAPTDSNAYGTATANGDTLTASDFMNLMVTQLQNQDPMDPTSDTQFASEMAQFSQLEETTDMNTTLTGYSEVSQVASGANLIGSTISTSQVDSSGNAISGVVSGVSVASGVVSVTVNGNSVPMSSITGVVPTSSSGSSSS